MKKPMIFVKKNSKELEPFNSDKLRNSLHKSGANTETIASITSSIQNEIYDGIPTKIIYKKAFGLLKKHHHYCASKYSLKKAIFALGPSGYFFEKLIAELLTHKGYKTQVSVILQGECVNHEIDVLAEKDGFSYAIECKFHSKQKYKSDVKIPLYINSRFIDIQKVWNDNPKKTTILKQGWLVTNTKFTTDAIAYAKCVHLSLFSWDYPKNNGIKDHIDRFGLYPVTVLHNLKKWQKTELIKNNIVLVIELKNNLEMLKTIGLSDNQIRKVKSELINLCK